MMNSRQFISQFFIALFLFFLCAEMLASNGKQVSLRVVDDQGTAIRDAFFLVSNVRYNRWQKLHEGSTDASGSSNFYLKTTGKEMVSVVAANYEPVVLPMTKARNGITLTAKVTLSILSYNVLEGFKQEEERKATFREWIVKYDPDIILFQEMNKNTETSLVEFAKSYGHAHSVLLKEKGYPTAITSKFPIEEAQRVLKGQTHGYITCKVKDIRFFVCHLSPREVETREAEIACIIEHASQFPNEKILIAGDLNSFNEYDEKAYGSNYPNERRQYQPTVPLRYEATNALLKAGYTDAFTLFSGGVFKATIPVSTAKNPANQGARYDYIFVNELLAPQCVYSDILRESTTDTLSDHYPMYIRIKP